MPKRGRKPLAAAGASLLAALGGAAPALAQVRCPADEPLRLCQDELDLQTGANLIQGSGARALGMGGAFLARADDATAASWNPAGLSYLRLPEASMAWSARASLDSEERDPDTATLLATDRRDARSPDFFALTVPFERGSVTGAAQLSFQRVIAFGGRRSIRRDDLRLEVDSVGGFDVIALGTGLHLTRRLRVGATLNRWFNGYSQHVDKLAQLAVPGKERHTVQDTRVGLSGWNVHVGTIWSPVRGLNLGAVAKTAFQAEVRLDRERQDTDITNGSRDQTSYNGFIGSDVAIDFPGAFGVGASWRPLNPLTLSVDYTRSFWSQATIRNFFTLPRAVGATPAPPPEEGVDLFPERPYPSLFQGQVDTDQLRAGLEYVVILGSAKVPLRGGAFSDRQYFREARTGDGPRFRALTAGAGLLVGPLLIDAAYVHETGRYFSRDRSGTRISVTADRVYVSLIYRHKGSP